jgi:Holliday junction resolvase RusA-like endonuclease
MPSLFIPGRPHAKRRHRVATINGRARAFNPPENERFEHLVRTLAAPVFRAPIEGPVRVVVVATFAPPASWSAGRRTATIGTPHTQKPDADNIAKAVKDALNRLAWTDDAQVAELTVRKLWGEIEGTRVEVTALGGAHE